MLFKCMQLLFGCLRVHHWLHRIFSFFGGNFSPKEIHHHRPVCKNGKPRRERYHSVACFFLHLINTWRNLRLRLNIHTKISIHFPTLSRQFQNSLAIVPKARHKIVVNMDKMQVSRIFSLRRPTQLLVLFLSETNSPDINTICNITGKLTGRTNGGILGAVSVGKLGKMVMVVRGPETISGAFSVIWWDVRFGRDTCLVLHHVRVYTTPQLTAGAHQNGGNSLRALLENVSSQWRCGETPWFFRQESAPSQLISAGFSASFCTGSKETASHYQYDPAHFLPSCFSYGIVRNWATASQHARRSWNT